jgi:hypothetical protein
MAKLYVFGIGGTGSRVLKSLTMLLASGVECGVDTIVPIVIDRDMSNKDLSRTKLLIEDYIKVHEISETNGKNRFFKTKIELLNNDLCLQLQDNTQRFDEFIGKSAMTKENQALIEMLFSEETLKMDMTAGFQGNPNIGSVVLNQFSDSDIFKAFASDFKDGDKIFIISSIFGGTGASGFPLLRKVLQTPNQKDGQGSDLQNWGLVNKAPIGAISVLPYFQVKSASNDEDSLVDSDTFTDKAKAALSYYKNEDKKIDTLYYIADKRTTNYEHHKGGNAQKNNAHFVELAAALSILDFVNPAKNPENIHRDSADNILRTTYKEFGIENDAAEINFATLEDETKTLIVNQLSRFLLFRNYMEYVYEKERKYQPYAKKHQFDDRFCNNDTIKRLGNVQTYFYEWLQEFETQNRKFSPFNLTTRHAFDFVKGDINVVVPANWFSKIRLKDWARVDDELNRQSSKIKLEHLAKMPKEKHFMELFYCAVSELLNFEN